MGSNKFGSLLIFRIILLLCNMILIAGLIVQTKWIFSSIILGIILVLQIIEIIRFSFSIKKDIDNLILSFEQQDLTSNVKINKYNPRFKESEISLNRIKQIIEKSRIEKEVQYNFLKILLENIPSGIIALKEGKLYLANKSASEILQLQQINSLTILSSNYSDFYSKIMNQDLVESELISIEHNSNNIQLSYSVSTMKLLQENVKIINFQNIKTTLEQNELLAWNKLIRTLTHEIMNSVTPIISLADTGLMISDNKNEPKKIETVTQQNIDHISKSFKSIRNKSVWLKEFLNDYRKLISIPQPKKEKIEINTLIDSVLQSIKSINNNPDILIENKTDHIMVNADRDLIELVLINMIKNALESGAQHINISNKQDNHRTYISISDNGMGIPRNILPEIFIPFFTTKQNGSGVGLSVSKQIMKLHKGNIEVDLLKKGTNFTLVFPKN